MLAQGRKSWASHNGCEKGGKKFAPIQHFHLFKFEFTAYLHESQQAD